MTTPITSTVHAFFATAARLGAQPALLRRIDGKWQARSWSDYAAEVRRAARALLALGMERGGAVAIIGPNRPEWLIADLATMAAGGVPAPIYPTLTAAQSAYVAAHCEARIAVVHDQKLLDKLLSVRAELPALRCCVLMEGTPAQATVPADGALAELAVLSWVGFLARESGSNDAALEARLAALAGPQLATLIYTSGTTGPPKAVMLTHGSLLAAAKVGCDTVGASAAAGTAAGSDVSVSYLPLSHIAEQMLSIHVPALGGGILYCCEKLEELPEILREARPHWMFGVPRVWEKLSARIEDMVAQAPPVRKALFAWARRQGLAADDARLAGRSPGVGALLAHRLVLSKLHARLGLDRVRYLGTGAAPISRRAIDFWRSIGLPLHGVWGLSEVSGAATFHPPGKARPEGVGAPPPTFELRIADDGEILLRGSGVFAGYLKDEAATREALEGGWFHTGDVGRLDNRGDLFITDRKKDLIITSGGKNVSPQNLEGMLSRIPGVGQAVIVGDNRKYLAALLTLEPGGAARVAQACGAAGSTPAEWSKDARFTSRIEAGVAEVNRQVAQYESIKRFKLLPAEFSIEGGELTPTMKVKRKAVDAKYAAEIAALFAEA